MVTQNQLFKEQIGELREEVMPLNLHMRTYLQLLVYMFQIMLTINYIIILQEKRLLGINKDLQEQVKLFLPPHIDSNFLGRSISDLNGNQSCFSSTLMHVSIFPINILCVWNVFSTLFRGQLSQCGGDELQPPNSADEEQDDENLNEGADGVETELVIGPPAERRIMP